MFKITTRNVPRSITNPFQSSFSRRVRFADSTTQPGRRLLHIPINTPVYENKNHINEQLQNLEAQVPENAKEIINKLLGEVLSNNGISKIEALHKLQELTGIQSQYFIFPQNSRIESFSEQELKLILMEAVLNHPKKDFYLTDNNLHYLVDRNLIEDACGRRLCENGFEKWSNRIRRIYRQLNIDPRDLSKEQLFTLINQAIIIYDSCYYRDRDKDLAKIRAALKLDHNQQKEDYERAMTQIKAGPSCAPPF